jgi:hypothetical protein
VSVPQTVLVYVLVPLGIYLLVAVLAAGRGAFRRDRYRPGKPWRYPPVWWTANPDAVKLPDVVESPNSTPVSTGRGGADGSW